ncbi:MAG: hypothetical protein U1D30_10370 [Planctomycetota bacterium]
MRYATRQEMWMTDFAPDLQRSGSSFARLTWRFCPEEVAEGQSTRHVAGKKGNLAGTYGENEQDHRARCRLIFFP